MDEQARQEENRKSRDGNDVHGGLVDVPSKAAQGEAEDSTSPEESHHPGNEQSPLAMDQRKDVELRVVLIEVGRRRWGNVGCRRWLLKEVIRRQTTTRHGKAQAPG